MQECNIRDNQNFPKASYFSDCGCQECKIENPQNQFSSRCWHEFDINDKHKFCSGDDRDGFVPTCLQDKRKQLRRWSWVWSTVGDIKCTWHAHLSRLRRVRRNRRMPAEVWSWKGSNKMTKIEEKNKIDDFPGAEGQPWLGGRCGLAPVWLSTSAAVGNHQHCIPNHRCHHHVHRFYLCIAMCLLRTKFRSESSTTITMCIIKGCTA